MRVKPWSWYFWAALTAIEGIETCFSYCYNSPARAGFFGAVFVFCVGCGLYSFVHRKPRAP